MKKAARMLSGYVFFGVVAGAFAWWLGLPSDWRLWVFVFVVLITDSIAGEIKGVA